ncbi:hypothetical protein Cgig2_033466 [Carnegiea gigantea]|uniref:DUF8040 domain-containing protein n=1 Tax=Carnegiea gigantea TaxID=171969 RepID=A0A9Q1GR64_9CARY|nr:hypothetical protein Cgig2_033466 [Carnegiea gigantea]
MFAFLGLIAALLRNYNSRDTDNETRVSQVPYQPYVNRDVSRENYINRVLRALLVNTMHMSVREQLLMFLHLLGDNVRFRIITGRFFRSTWTAHSYFHINHQNYLGHHSKLQNQSGYGWDEDMRMIHRSLDVYNTYVEYLNKKIEMYDEMSIVIGKDVT